MTAPLAPGFDRAAILAARAEAIRRAPVPAEPGFAAILFRAVSDRYAIRLDEVEAVHRLADLAVVPGAPAYVRGVALLGGEIVALVDLRLLLGSSGRGIEDLRRAVVVGGPDRRVAFLAGDVEEIARVPTASIRPAPRPRPEAEEAPCVEGVIYGDRLLLSVPAILGVISPTTSPSEVSS